ncbi:MarR family winged helix-turn-helix transcriptional regulator [Undibacterium umbellatum]|uniref:MarR family transcriptional regulator n=1 Tax=Undibacterium umbellatum TaxID=2762300 RepID=A0ABR6ZIG0_9BURK|nr:MarR family transcriptional regulator [Undibacterium umbellatum]MBC3911511.1 MarR family transcriptional regulator [Undibacterium umbellatum]
MPKQKTDILKAQTKTRAAAPKRQSSTAQLPTFNARIEGIEYGILDELTGYAVRRAQLSIYADFSASLGVYDITPQRFSSLVIVGNNPGISQTRLAEVMGIARSGVVAIIDNFEQAGLLERQDSGDRRSYNLHLTKEGQKQLEKYKLAVKEHDDRVSQQLSVKERQQLRALLGKLCIDPK